MIVTDTQVMNIKYSGKIQGPGLAREGGNGCFTAQAQVPQAAAPAVTAAKEKDPDAMDVNWVVPNREECQHRGLCFHCGVRYTPDHMCAKRMEKLKAQVRALEAKEAEVAALAVAAATGTGLGF
jgi:hypothetical protein